MKKNTLIIPIAIGTIIAMIVGVVGFYIFQNYLVNKITVEETFLEENEEIILKETPLGATTTFHVWQGGTGLSEYTAGDLIYATSTSELVKLGIGSTDDVLTVAGGVPSWSAGAGGSLWTDAGTFTHLTATTDDVVIGASATSTAPLWMDVSAGDLTLSGNLNLKDDKYLYFDTAKSYGIYYNSDVSGLVYDPDINATGRLTFISNTGVDGSGNWEPEFNMRADGSVYITNTTQGSAGDKFFLVDMTDGIRLDTGGTRAIIKADNITTSDKTFQFPNLSGTIVTTAGAGATVDLGAFRLLTTSDIGASGSYVANVYTDKVYLNSTAILDGGTAGRTQVTGNLGIGISPVADLHIYGGASYTYMNLGTSDAAGRLQFKWDESAEAGFFSAYKGAYKKLEFAGDPIVFHRGDTRPGTDSAYTSGTSSYYWEEGYFDKLYLDSDSTIVAADVDAWITATLTEEEVEDYVGGMLGGTETLITVDYQDASNDIDFVVNNDLHSYDWSSVVDADITNTLTASIVSDVDKGDVNISSGVWLVEDFTISSQATGDILYNSNGSDWTRLALDSPGKVLAATTDAVYWATAGGGETLAQTLALGADANDIEITSVGSIHFTDENESPGTAGELKYDSTVAGFSDGLMVWYDDDEIRYLVDLDTLPGDGDNGEVVRFSSANDNFYLSHLSIANLTAATSYVSLAFDDTETMTFTTSQNTSDHFLNIHNTLDDVGNEVTLLLLTYDDDADADADFIKCQDDKDGSPSTVFKVDYDGGTTSLGTIEGATLTEGGNAVYSSGETPSGELGGTYANITIDDNVSVSNWNLTTPTITTGVTLTGADHNPAATGELRYDNTISGMSGGGLRWFDDDSVRLLVDLETDPTDDDYVVAYDSTADGFYMMSAGTGDVTAVGDCASGLCFDGSSDGGTNITFYNIDSNKTQLIASDTASDLVITLPATTGALVHSGVATLSSLISIGTVATGEWQATAINDTYIPNDITIDLATLATTVTITDNESTAENNAVIFTAGGALEGGNLDLESDGTFFYTPSTGKVNATSFLATTFAIGDATITEAELEILDGATVTTTILNYIDGATGVTGTDSTNIVFSTSPTLVTPALGTPSALVGTNITGTAASLTAGFVSTITGLAPDTATTQATQGNITSLGTLTGLTMGGNIVMGDNSITGIDTLTFTDTAGTIAGIANGNLVDKSASETMTGTWIAADHATALTDEIGNWSYGTGDPATADTTTIGSVYFKYTP